MSSNLENLRSRIMASINSKKEEKKVPTGPRAAMGASEGAGSNESGSSGGWQGGERAGRGAERGEMRGERGDGWGRGGEGAARRGGHQTASNSMPLGAPSRFGGGGEARRGPGGGEGGWSAPGYDTRRGGRVGSRYGGRFDGGPGRIGKPAGGRGYSGPGRFRDGAGRGAPAARGLGRKARAGPPFAREWVPDEREVDWSRVPALEERPRLRPTRWDVTPRGFEHVPAERAKLSGLFPLPGQPQELDRMTLEGIAEKGALNRRTKILFEDPTKPNLAQCKLNRTLVLSGEGVGDLDRVAACVSDMLKNITLEGEHVLSSCEQRKGALVLELNSEESATLVLAAQAYLKNQLNSHIVWQRPEEYVARLDAEEPICDRNLIAMLGVPLQSASEVPGWLQEQDITYSWLHSVEVARQGANIFTQAVLYTPASAEAPLPSPQGVQVLQPNASELTQNYSDISYQSFSKVVAVQTHKPSKVVCLLNAVDPLELKNERYYREVHDAVMFGTPVLNCGPVESVKIPVPGPDFRNNFESVSLQIGKIFIKFKELSGAERAMLMLAGMRFCERTIICSYYSERDFDMDLF
ncbi:ADR130Wp [Eremothecium gossypii ATCC 10895]|uniref:ADR130Wp n=1 Tax=Eremothecium gossypii (strain ATCC 10895 / CBS 109.51 / FGSC 9923 / NRRL Y-1056) TaxID=284811 RepID=Q759Z3_EREGS|nr:ADR130Wp [Eremothecium gossypii ATCC 10895]AAS52050.2 ADR130Wp [Eremothecium gossypii ATCC 10895]AEY96349.1 FADR130Wp [Eremothecium gossypii FDAG1]